MPWGRARANRLPVARVVVCFSSALAHGWSLSGQGVCLPWYPSGGALPATEAIQYILRGTGLDYCSFLRVDNGLPCPNRIAPPAQGGMGAVAHHQATPRGAQMGRGQCGGAEVGRGITAGQASRASMKAELSLAGCLGLEGLILARRAAGERGVHFWSAEGLSCGQSARKEGSWEGEVRGAPGEPGSRWCMTVCNFSRHDRFSAHTPSRAPQ